MEPNKFSLARKMPVGVAFSVDLPAVPAPPERPVAVEFWDFLIEEIIKVDPKLCRWIYN